MDQFIFASAIILVALMTLPLYRSVVGPTAPDRLIGVNAIGSKTTSLLLLVGFSFHRVDMFVDIALAYAMLNFITVLAAGKYFQKKKGLRNDT